MARVSELEQATQDVKLPALAHRTEAANPAAAALEAHAKASIEARYIMALRQPRNWDRVRQGILHECGRPSFARDKSTLYKKPIGQNGVEGLGIRFVEMALRCMTNVMNECRVIYEDDFRRVIYLGCTDLEGNVTWPREITVAKTVERSKPLDDGTYLSMRMNTYNKPVYTIPATDEDLLNKENALISKTMRTLGLRHIPGDIQDEAEALIRKVRADTAAKDPDAEIREITDWFYIKLRVPADELLDYVGHPLAQCTGEELADLRAVAGAIRDGEATWAQTIAAQREHGRPRTEPKPKPEGEAGEKEEQKKPDEPAAGNGTGTARGVEAAEARSASQHRTPPRTQQADRSSVERIVEDEGGTRLFKVTGNVKAGDEITSPQGPIVVVLRDDASRVVVRPK